MLVLRIKTWNKKGATMADILSYFIVLVGGSVTIMLIAFFVVAPAMGERAKLSVTENVAEFNENLFLFNYLRSPVEEKTMADLIIRSYIEDDHEMLRQETANFLNELYDPETRVCCKVKSGIFRSVYYWKEKEECSGVVSKEKCIKWQIYIDDELFISTPTAIGNEKTIHETYIPNYYTLDPINFEFVFY